MEQGFVEARSLVSIYYSSVTNTSKGISYQLQDKLEQQKFLTTVNNVGDFNPEQWKQYQGTILLLLSTYGNGNSPPDGEKFVEWLESQAHPTNANMFSNISFAIMALGNQSFQHFCGNGKTVRQLLLKLGAKQIKNIQLCNSLSEEQSAQSQFPEWSDDLIKIMKEMYELKKMKKGQVFRKYKINITSDPVTNWEEAIQDQQFRSHLGQQFLTYYQMQKAHIVSIKELRKNNDDGRSTLRIRAAIPKGMKLNPACNMSVFPLNIRKPEEKPYQDNIIIQPVKKNSKVPYPPMSLEELWTITNFSQKVDLNMLKKGMKMSHQPAEVIDQYQEYLKDPQVIDKKPIRCSEIYNTLKPGYQFLVELGLNSVRPYTLASWNQNYFDLVVSIDPKGLTSQYYKSIPKQIRVCPIQSTFFIPSGRPIIMVANGSGIAPFRSLAQYLIPRLQQEKVELSLYFGIQNREVDFYFGQEWLQYESEGKIKLNIAESRANPEQKFYVQHLIARDKQLIKKHIFEKKGVIFICGGSSMAKAVDTQLYEAVKLHEPVPFKAFKQFKALGKKKTIVRQVFE